MSKASPIFKVSGLIAILFLGACSSGNDTTPPTIPPLPDIPPSGTSLGGNGQLGIIVGGIVSVLNSTGTELASSITDSDGNFGPVTIPGTHSGPVIVEISPASDGSSFFICDFGSGCPSPTDNTTIAFGGQVPYTATLSAVLPDETEVNAVNVNPITTAIRARAEALGLSAETIAQADSEMAAELSRLIGVTVPTNIATIPNVNLVNGQTDETDDPDTAAAAVNLSMLNAGLISLISETSGNDDIDSVVASLSSGFSATGEFDVSNEFNSGDVQSGELLFAIEQQIATLADEQPDASDTVQEIAPENDLETVANEAADMRNEIAPVAPEISGTPAISVIDNMPYSFTPTSNDPDGDPLTFSVVNLPTWATFNSQSGTISGTPAKTDVGTTSDIAISVSDGVSTSSLAAFNIEVINANSPPLISGTPATTVDEDTPYEFTPTATDIDPGDILIFSLENAPAWMSIDSATGAVTGSPANADVGSTTGIVISVSDGEASTSLAAFNVTVVNVNDAPTLTGTPATSVSEDTAYLFTPAASDIDSTALSFSATGLPAWASINVNSGAITGTPDNSDVGTSEIITLSVTDGLATTALAGFRITVNNVNDAPTIGGTPATTIAQDALYEFTPTSNDVDVGDSISFLVTNLPAWLTFDDATGSLSGTPGNSDVGSSTGIIITVVDANDASSALDAFDISVTNVNDAPTISGTPASTVAQDASYQFTPTSDDIDVGDTLTFSIASQPAWSSFNTTTGALTGTPTNADVGTDNAIEITVTDSSNATATLAPFSITISNVNDAPTIGGTPATSAMEDVVYTFTPISGDIDVGDVLSFSINKNIATDIPWATFALETGTLTGTPGNGDVGSVTGIIISVTDSSGASADLNSFDLTIVNEPLSISGTPDTSAVQDVAYSFTPTVTDSEDIDSYSILNLPSWALFNTFTGQLSGTPGNSDVGDDNGISISVSDGNETSTLASFNISTVNVNDPPVISGTPTSPTLKDVAFSFTPSVTDIDNPPDPLTYSILNQPMWNVVNFNTSTGELSGTPNGTNLGDFNNIMITVNDGLATDTLTFSVTVVEGEKVLVSWSAPTTRENGQAITNVDLLGYQLEYFEQSTPGTIITVGTSILDNNTTSYTTPFLGIGTWHFAVKAIELTGFDGDLSPEVLTVVDGVPG